MIMLTKIDDLVWGVPMIVLILSVGILLTLRLNGLQVTKLPLAIKHIFAQRKSSLTLFLIIEPQSEILLIVFYILDFECIYLQIAIIDGLFFPVTSADSVAVQVRISHTVPRNLQLKKRFQ